MWLTLFWICFGLLLYTYLIYPVVLIGLVRLKKTCKEKPLLQKNPSVSLVIAAYNEEKVIDEKMQNCLRLDFPHGLLEVIVISDGSSDRTNEVVKKYTEMDARIHLVDLPRTGKSGALNKGVSFVNNDIIVFSDANTEYVADAIKNLVNHFDDPKVGCVGGRLIYRNPHQVVSGEGESFYWRYETALKKLESKLGYVAGANGAIYAIRRELFKSLPKRTINDDFMTSMRIVLDGYKCIYEEKAVAYEDVAPTVQSEFDRHVRDGAGHYIAVWYLRGLLNPFLGLKSFIYWSHRMLRWLAPFVLILFFGVNSVLAHNLFYGVFFLLHLAFYIMAILTPLFFLERRLPFLMYIPFYFSNLNVALFLGFIKAITGLQKTTWESTKRA